MSERLSQVEHGSSYDELNKNRSTLLQVIENPHLFENVFIQKDGHQAKPWNEHDLRMQPIYHVDSYTVDDTESNMRIPIPEFLVGSDGLTRRQQNQVRDSIQKLSARYHSFSTNGLTAHPFIDRVELNPWWNIVVHSVRTGDGKNTFSIGLELKPYEDPVSGISTVQTVENIRRKKQLYADYEKIKSFTPSQIGEVMEKNIEENYLTQDTLIQITPVSLRNIRNALSIAGYVLVLKGKGSEILKQAYAIDPGEDVYVFVPRNHDTTQEHPFILSVQPYIDLYTIKAHVSSRRRIKEREKFLRRVYADVISRFPILRRKDDTFLSPHRHVPGYVLTTYKATPGEKQQSRNDATVAYVAALLSDQNVDYPLPEQAKQYLWRWMDAFLTQTDFDETFNGSDGNVIFSAVIDNTVDPNITFTYKQPDDTYTFNIWENKNSSE